MAVLRPTRRELIAAGPLLLGAAALPARAFGAADLQALNFLVVGDWGRDGKKGQQAVADRMAITAKEVGSRFVVSTGDNFYFRGVLERDRPAGTRRSRKSIPRLRCKRPGIRCSATTIMAAMSRRSSPPEAVPALADARARYAIGADDLKRDDVALFFIDMVAWLGKGSFPFKWLGSDIAPDEQREQRDWLVKQLRASPARHKFVFGHHGIYSIGPHGGTMRMKELDDVLRRFGVTAYVHGHDHCLYHISRAGLHYVCSGAGWRCSTIIRAARNRAASCRPSATPQRATTSFPSGIIISRLRASRPSRLAPAAPPSSSSTATARWSTTERWPEAGSSTCGAILRGEIGVALVHPVQERVGLVVEGGDLGGDVVGRFRLDLLVALLEGARLVLGLGLDVLGLAVARGEEQEGSEGKKDAHGRPLRHSRAGGNPVG